MNIFDSLLLGTVQGLTEFLPISSSGHLILMRDVLGINTQNGLAFDAILQLGTILAVFAYFKNDIANLIRAAFKITIGKNKEIPAEDKKLLIGIIVATIPALILGLLLENAMETIFRNALLVAMMLIAGSLLFIVAEKISAGYPLKREPDTRASFLIGLFQALALIPGVSRSGATISGGLMLGMAREKVARFSFLLSLPIITGSGLKKLIDVTQSGTLDTGYANLFAGFTVAFVIGWICISFLLRYLKNHTLHAFAWYRIALGLAVIALKI